MKKFLLAILVSLFCSTIFAQTLSKDEIKQSSLAKLISRDYSVYQYDDGDIKVSYDGMNVHLILDTERGILKFRTYWKGAASIKESDAVKLVNNWNKDKIFTTAIYDKDDDGCYFSLEYFITTVGGTNAAAINDILDWIFCIADSYGYYLSEANALE